MSSTQITIKDIARKLNIAPSTVSRALKGHPDISESTKEAVTRVARELDYQPNTVAQNLRQSKTFTIGVIVPEIVHYFFSSVISGIEDVAYSMGYHVMICQSNESMEREQMNANALMASRVDGLLVSVSKTTTSVDHLLALQKRGIPIVQFDRCYPDLDTCSVTAQDYQGGYNATQHLIDKGCKKILHLTAPGNLIISQERAKGYKDALQKNQIIFDPNLIILGDSFKTAKEAVEEVLKHNSPPDAIFAVNDLAAIGAMKAIKEHGLRIPDDVAIVGFSDDPTITELMDPPLTSVLQPGFEMGMLATRMLLEQMDKKSNRGIRHEVLRTELVVRSSSDR
ncbi:MAG: LacI family DNA-binding transcriptional regulator [Cyclobacteriaceae bacterium]|nr:LacI family DNA-binding transcriptional regulator [Cyclobacteriaceae bacterium]